ncbi:gluconokinase [soil metagenome]
MIVVLMGVSGSGKTTVGQRLAESLGWPFLDADDYHPDENIAKMRSATPLNDDDRLAWLEALARIIDAACDEDRDFVLACSALKHKYQKYLRTDRDCVHYVHLTGSKELIAQRLADRREHFMDPNLLSSQFEALEPPEEALAVDIEASPEAIAAEIRSRLGL